MGPGPQTAHEQVIVVDGRFDAFIAQEIRGQVEEAISTKPESLIVDLSEAPFIDSAGLAVLVWGRKQMATINGVLVVVRPRTKEAFRAFELNRARVLTRCHHHQTSQFNHAGIDATTTRNRRCYAVASVT